MPPNPRPPQQDGSSISRAARPAGRRPAPATKPPPDPPLITWKDENGEIWVDENNEHWTTE